MGTALLVFSHGQLPMLPIIAMNMANMVPNCLTKKNQYLLPSSMQRNPRNIDLDVSHDAVQTALKRLGEGELCRFSVSVFDKRLICHPAIILYCCDIIEGKYISGVRHGGPMYPFICCLTAKHKISEHIVDTKRLENKMVLIYSNYEKNYTIYSYLAKNRKTREALRKHDNCSALLDFYFLKKEDVCINC